MKVIESHKLDETSQKKVDAMARKLTSRKAQMHSTAEDLDGRRIPEGKASKSDGLADGGNEKAKKRKRIQLVVETEEEASERPSTAKKRARGGEDVHRKTKGAELEHSEKEDDPITERGTPIVSTERPPARPSIGSPPPARTTARPAARSGGSGSRASPRRPVSNRSTVHPATPPRADACPQPGPPLDSASPPQFRSREHTPVLDPTITGTDVDALTAEMVKARENYFRGWDSLESALVRHRRIAKMYDRST